MSMFCYLIFGWNDVHHHQHSLTKRLVNICRLPSNLEELTGREQFFYPHQIFELLKPLVSATPKPSCCPVHLRVNVGTQVR